MQPSSTDIEQIIRVVMQRLAAAGDLMSGVDSIADTQEMDSELVLRERVVTLATLEGKLGGKNKVRVHARAIVTPAVTDELRQRKVSLVREGTSSRSSGVAAGSSSSPTKVAPVLVCGSALWFDSLVRHLCPKQALVEACDDAHAIGAVKQHMLRGGRRAVWLTTKAYAASISAAKTGCCTSVFLPGLGELPAALDQANPDCFIVDSSRWTVAAIGNLVRALASHKLATGQG